MVNSKKNKKHYKVVGTFRPDKSGFKGNLNRGLTR